MTESEVQNRIDSIIGDRSDGVENAVAGWRNAFALFRRTAAPVDWLGVVRAWDLVIDRLLASGRLRPTIL